MVIKQLADVVLQYYERGRLKSTAVTYTKEDIEQMCYLAAGNLFRQQYYSSKQKDEYGQPDYSFLSPLLSVQRFNLSEADARGMRRADMGAFDLFRLPKNSHFTNLYTVSDGCEGDDGFDGTINQVKPGEENFYLRPDYDFYKFYVVKGRGVNTYHFPPCITAIEVETTYSSPDVDISYDVAYEVAVQVLGVTLRVPGFAGKTIDNSFADPLLLSIKRQPQEPQPEV